MVRAVLRTKSVTTKVTEREYARLEELAGASDVNLSEWVRGRLLRADPLGGEGDVLGELLALRMILINLLFSLGKGEPMGLQAMKELIEKADGDKGKRLMERQSAAHKTVETVRPEPESGSVLEVGEGA